jgi:hypothetical protein
VNVFFLCYFRVPSVPQVTFRCIKHNTCILICRINIPIFTDIVTMVNIMNIILNLKCYCVLYIIDGKTTEMQFLHTFQV